MFRRQTNQVLLISIMSVRLLVIFLVILQTAIAIIIQPDFKIDELPDRTVCGIQGGKDKIVGGEIADIGEFPWMAAVEFTNRRTKMLAGVRCGGSLINNRFVITAAHCINDREFEIINVWLGEWNITSDPDCQESGAILECADNVLVVGIEQAISHPFYRGGQGTSDIGLLRLKHDVTYTNFIHPICLPSPNSAVPPAETEMTVAGWGITENGTTSIILLKVDVPLLPNENCSLKTDDRIASASQLCAGKLGKDSCTGDSGGPLMRTYEDNVIQQTQWYLEGVVSYGKGCGSNPAVYTRVSRFIGWIMNNIVEEQYTNLIIV